MIKSVQNLIEIIDKTQKFCEENSKSEVDMLSHRLAPDMLDLKQQIQLVSDHLKGYIARVSQIQNPIFPDTERSFDELKERLNKTLEFAQSIDLSNVSELDVENLKISFPFFPPGMFLSGNDYVMTYAIPNFYFHYVTAYDNLRNQGLDIGKLDYLGMLPLKS